MFGTLEVGHTKYHGVQRLQCWPFAYQKFYCYNREDFVFVCPQGVERFVLSLENVWYGRLRLLFNIIGPWKAASRAGWGHGHHSTQISRRAAQWRPSFRPRSRKGRLCPGRGDGCPMYFVNSWALGWSRDM